MYWRYKSHIFCASTLLFGLQLAEVIKPANADDKIRISISNAGGAFSVAGVALKRGFYEGFCTAGPLSLERFLVFY